MHDAKSHQAGCAAPQRQLREGVARPGNVAPRERAGARVVVPGGLLSKMEGCEEDRAPTIPRKPPWHQPARPESTIADCPRGIGQSSLNLASVFLYHYPLLNSSMVTNESNRPRFQKALKVFFLNRERSNHGGECGRPLKCTFSSSQRAEALAIKPYTAANPLFPWDSQSITSQVDENTGLFIAGSCLVMIIVIMVLHLG